MPNWCYTQIIFHGSEREIVDFHGKINEWISKNYMENGFGPTWLGNVVCGAGLGDYIDVSGAERIHCRGTINSIEDVEVYDGSATFFIDTETAWCPTINMWSRIIEKLEYKTVHFSYMAEEPGEELYEIYDRYGDFTNIICGCPYIVDMYIDDPDINEGLTDLGSTCYYSGEELSKRLQKILNSEETNIDILINKMHEYEFKSEHSCVHINHYTILDQLKGDY